MPKTLLTVETLRGLRKTPPARETDYWDSRQPGLVLRARPNGRHAYRVWLGRGRWFTLGAVSSFKTPDLARTQAQKRLGEVAAGADPQAEKRRERAETVKSYLSRVYTPWLTSHWRRGAETAVRLTAAFGPTLGHLHLDAVSSWHLEQWRHARLTAGSAPATINRELGSFKAMFNRAVEWGHLAAHPFPTIKALKEDKIGRLRYLTDAEDARLRAALVARDDRRRQERDTANTWRRERGYAEWPAYTQYSDHLTPLSLLALNTGLRFGELTGLQWRDVDLVRALVTVRPETAKSGRARHLPLNRDALQIFRAWKPADAAATAFVFPGRDGQRLVEIKTAWAALLKAAGITGFRFHDTRHTFASRLVTAGVDLNTVRELLGHADIKMTLRYAHLAPEHSAAAVATLNVEQGA